MNSARIGVVGAALSAAAWIGSTTIACATAAPGGVGVAHDSIAAGADSARVAALLLALSSGDALVCELIADGIGNSWNSDVDRPGQLSDARRALALAKDSVQGHVSQPSAIRLLSASLAQDNSCVRRVAAKMLGRSRVDPATLTALLNDNAPRIREAAALAIGEGGSRWTTAPAMRVALESTLATRGAPEAAMAAWALGEIGSVRSLNALDAAVGDKAATVRYAAAAAIGELHDLERAPPTLVSAARSADLRLRQVVAMTLAEIHDPATVDVLIGLLSVNDREARARIAEALGEIGLPKANEALVRLLKDPDADVRRAAAEALGEIKDERDTA